MTYLLITLIIMALVLLVIKYRKPRTTTVAFSFTSEIKGGDIISEDGISYRVLHANEHTITVEKL